MAYINFDLTDCDSLHTLASPGAGVAGNLPAGLNAQPGLYLIFNRPNNNRYIGKTGDLQDRFEGRMLAVNELGLSQANLAQIGVFWGEASPYSTPAPAVPAGAPLGAPPVPAPLAHTVLAPGAALNNGFRILRNAAGAAPPMPNALVGPPGGAINYGAAQVTTLIDGQNINVEALLIRMFRQGMGVGGTMTNRAYMGLFTNTLPNELIVEVEWGALGAVGMPAGHFAISIPAGGQF